MEGEWNVEDQTNYGKKTPAYTTVDLNLRYKIWKGLFTNFLVTNLFDEEIRYPTNNSSQWLDKGMLGFGRKYQLTMGYKF